VLERKVPEPATAKELDEFQEVVANHRHGALLVLAGPGTGKTATLTETVVRIINEGEIQASEILVLTFARKAAEEIRDRIVARVGSGKLPAVSTLHALALSIVREFSTKDITELKLMSAPEQELVVRELVKTTIDQSVSEKSVGWPEALDMAIQTRGMSVEIRNAMARARSLNLDDEGLAKLAIGNEEWTAVAQLMAKYLDDLDQRTLTDYNELIVQALEITRNPVSKRELQNRYRVVVVDEYQDTDPLQVEILQNLVSRDACLIAVGDPDQSIYGFRGADSRAVNDFASDFSYMSAHQLPQEVALKVTRRFGSNIADHAQRLIERNGYEEIPGKEKREHRKLITTKTEPGEIFIAHYESAESEAEEVAEKVRALVTTQNFKWSDVAILVRSGSVSIPVIERALIRAGIPVDVTFDELPIAKEPAVQVLLTALKVAVKPSELSDNPSIASFLLTSGLGGLDSADLRHLGRQLRDAYRNSSEQTWSEELIARALIDPTVAPSIHPEVGGLALTKLIRLRDLLYKASDMVLNKKTVDQVLWYIWNSSTWKDALRAKALAGDAQATQAGHDLDAVITLMDLAKAQGKEAGKARGISTFIAEVNDLLVPAQPTLRAFEPDAVALMTAHRAKGLEWKAVFICSADEETWPDVRRRNSILEPERLTRNEISKHIERHVIVEEERRLFYVAVTRAQERLYISSTSADPEQGRVASRFISNMLKVNPQTQVQAETPIAIRAKELQNESRYSVQGLVAQLRRIAASELGKEVTSELRQAAEERLAQLAKLKTANGESFVPSANPDSWWGTAELTENIIPVDKVDAPVYVRGSSLQKIHDCSLSWFMQDRAFAQESTSSAMNFGSIVHALAEGVFNEEIDDSIEVIAKKLESIWSKVKFATDIEGEREKQNAIDCMRRFLHWRKNSAHRFLAAEIDFDDHVDITNAEGATERFRIKGQIDIVEISNENAVYIADIKTVGTAPKKEDTETNMQLGLYQYAVQRGFVEHKELVTLIKPIKTAGAALICVRLPEGTSKGEDKPGPMVRTQDAMDVESPWIEANLLTAAAIVRGETFFPTKGNACKYCSIKIACPLQPTGGQVID
jgi:superfamily I DNA/RNA helicase/RecB family exonuclease